MVITSYFDGITNHKIYPVSLKIFLPRPDSVSQIKYSFIYHSLSADTRLPLNDWDAPNKSPIMLVTVYLVQAFSFDFTVLS
jgi:hypothetical protein